MKDVIIPVGILTILLCGVLFAIGGGHGVERSFENCITYHNQMSVVEANKICNTIVRGNK